MKKNPFAFVFCMSAPIAGVAGAHGPVIQIGLSNGQLVTRGYFADEASDGTYGPVTPTQRVYSMPMVKRSLGDANDGWYAQDPVGLPASDSRAFIGPGVAYGLGGFVPGTQITTSYADGLKLWDGASFVDPGATQIQGRRGSISTPSATFTSTDAGPFTGYSFTTLATDSGASHKQSYWRLLGDGVSPTSASPDGVYLVTLQLSSSTTGVAASLPYYVLFEKNATSEQISAAGAYLNANVVPEPTAVLPLIAITGLVLRRRR